jgi:hypothetical protein
MPALPSPSPAENIEVSEFAVSLPKLEVLSFAEASVTRGTAEFLATKLTGRGHSCPHFPKYRVEDEKSPFPSRLGFFHRTDSNFSYLDTRKLCKNCCEDVVPDGYNVWSIFMKKSTAAEPEDKPGQTQSGSLGRRWLDISPSSGFYPQAFQAGTEVFTGGIERKRSRFAKDTAIVIAKIIAADPVAMPIPLVEEAKEAWQWLESQGKPFYIDQLHLTKNWSPLAEKNATTDAAISAESGTAFSAAALLKPKNSASGVKPKKTSSITKSKKLSFKDTVVSAAELATESEPTSAKKPKKPKIEQAVASLVEMPTEDHPPTKVN